MEHVTIPKIKDCGNLCMKSYSFYEYDPQSPQLIVCVNTTENTVKCYNKKPGVNLTDLELSKIQVHFDFNLKPGNYIFDVVVYSYNMYYIVDILYDSNVDLLKTSYLNRLHHLKKFSFNPPFYVKPPSEPNSSYNGFSEILIVKDNEADLAYNKDYKFYVQKTYKISGIAEKKIRNLRSDIDLVKLANEYSIDAELPPNKIRGKLIKIASKNNTELTAKLYTETHKKLLLVSDKNDCIFGVCYNTISGFEMPSKFTNHHKKWIKDDFKNKYFNIQYLEYPIVGSFSQKSTLKSDLIPLKLCKVLSENGKCNERIDIAPIKTNKLNTMSDVIAYTVKSVKLPHFNNDNTLYSDSLNSLSTIYNMILGNGGHVSMVSRPIKRKLKKSNEEDCESPAAKKKTETPPVSRDDTREDYEDEDV